MTTDLDALAASFEPRRGTRCSVCAFIESQPEPGAWDALMAGPRTAVGVLGALRACGFAGEKKNTVENHRREHHRGCRRD